MSFFTEHLNNEELEYLEKNTVFSSDEIVYLFNRFCYLDRRKCGYLSYTDFQLIPEFVSNPFCDLIVGYIEEYITEDEKLNFAYFLDFLKLFHAATPKSARINYLFNLFDLNKDHKLCIKVLSKIMQIIGVKEAENAAGETLKQYDIGQKGFLDIFDFTRLYNEDDNLEKILVIDFKKNIFVPERAVGLIDIFWGN
ncbi:hypothetical protein NUSPORA_02831 [Nucleospora cyclopteri]